MNTSLKPTTPSLDYSRFVYVRGIYETEIAELPDEALAEVSNPNELVVVTNGEGQKLAIIEGHDAAIAAAHAYELQPVSLH